MAQQKVDVQLRGLWTSPNNLGGVPQGALQRADNVVLNSNSLIESRRGQTQYGSPLSIGPDQVNKLFTYADNLITNYDSKMAYDSGNGLWVDYSGSYNQPNPDYKMRSLEALKNFYFTTDEGIYKIDALTSTPRAAGVPGALGGTASLTGSTGFLLDNSAVAYRIVWGYIDSNNNLLLGAPSQRIIVSNNSGTDKDVQLTFIIPADITTEYFYQIYRSNGTATYTDEPTDELQLVLQGNPTSAEITARSFTTTDNTPYSLMRATLYTSPSQEGIANANTPPPLAYDMDVFKTCAFYANVRQKQLLTLAMIAAGTPALGYLSVIADTTNTSDQITGLQQFASLVVQDLTYTAVTAGFDGNDISITYTGGGTAGAEVVTVIGSSISVQIQSGVSTATQIRTAILASAPAVALVGCVVSGSGAATQVTTTETFLSGGSDTTRINIGMRLVASGVPAGSLVIEIIDADTVRLDNDATATATVAMEFQDRFTIAGVDYWASSVQDAATNRFLVDTSSTPAQNIDTTANNLIQVINTSPSNTTIYAYYTSGTEDLPGNMLFQERALGGAAFLVTSTNGSSFSPNLPNQGIISNISVADPTVITSIDHGLSNGDSITIYNSDSTPLIDDTYNVTVISPDTFSIPVEVTIAGTTGYWIKTDLIVQSDNEVRQNRVMISKPSQVESVPIYRYFDIGAANFPIQRVIALRDGILFFKLDGIYRIAGETFENFTVSLLDNTVKLLVPESAKPFNNQVFCYTNQGICAVSDTGVEIMSVPIEDQVIPLQAPQFTNFVDASFGVSYESARLYLFFTVTTEDDVFATQAFVYNSLTKSWTRWVMDRTCGIVNNDKLYMAEPDTGQVLVERKTFTNLDYADQQFPVTINSINSETEFTLATASLVSVGMTIAQGDRASYISAVDGNVITVVSTHGFTAGAADVYQPIENHIQWIPIDVENPGILKQFSEISLFFKNAAFREIVAGFGTNVIPDELIVPIANNSLQGSWGNFSWGNQQWGGTLGGQAVLRTYIPREAQRGSWLYLSLRTEEAFTGFSLQGVSVIFNPMTSRQR